MGECNKWTSIVQEVKKLQNQGVNIFDYIRIKIGNGDNTSFWKDKWHNEGVLKDVFPSSVTRCERQSEVNYYTKLIDYSFVISFRRIREVVCKNFNSTISSQLVSTNTLSSAVTVTLGRAIENISGEFSVRQLARKIPSGGICVYTIDVSSYEEWYTFGWYLLGFRQISTRCSKASSIDYGGSVCKFRNKILFEKEYSFNRL
ncbi:hypothetical protein Tco_0415915 [Tanacetum coccineum]